ncbi:MAG: alpha-L-fucosidase [Planctomycetes bacterium]|nr:alpha-L-fucosidase [Planctomycetota bacterium]
MQPWFIGAKLGIFIHWGIYSVKGVVESWPFFNDEMTWDAYMAQLGGFTAKRYDPGAWAKLFQDCGARYAVLTTKHHDGVALWDTELSDLNVVERTPAGRDLVGPFCAALRKRGMKVGLYFSHLDWSHPDYATIFNEPFPEEPWRSKKWAYPQPPKGAEPERWEAFLRFHRGQLKELCTRYHPDLLWFDGDWDRTDAAWRMAELREQLHRWAPGVILNSRMKGHGDYETPEQGQPMTAPAGATFEYCVTLNDSWGWRPSDTNYKPIDRLIRLFVETVSMGGNLLLGIGPKPDGTFSAQQTRYLKALGAWNRRHGEAVFGTVAGLPHGHHYGPSTLSADRKTLYLFLFDPPRHGVVLKGLRTKVRRASLVGARGKLRFTQGKPAVHGVPSPVWIGVPTRGLDKHCAVVKLELDGPLVLYSGEGSIITSN